MLKNNYYIFITINLECSILLLDTLFYYKLFVKVNNPQGNSLDYENISNMAGFPESNGLHSAELQLQVLFQLKKRHLLYLVLE